MSALTDSIGDLAERVHELQKAAAELDRPADEWTGGPEETEVRVNLSQVLDLAIALDRDIREVDKVVKALRQEVRTVKKIVSDEHSAAMDAHRRRTKELEREQRVSNQQESLALWHAKQPEKKDIYVIRNDVNDKAYVGQSIDPKGRFNGHKQQSRSTYRIEGELHRAMNEIGIEHFYLEILEHDVENYDEREAYWIEELGTLYPNGYNHTTGGMARGYHSRPGISNRRPPTVQR